MSFCEEKPPNEREKISLSDIEPVCSDDNQGETSGTISPKCHGQYCEVNHAGAAPLEWHSPKLCGEIHKIRSIGIGIYFHSVIANIQRVDYAPNSVLDM